MKEIRKDQDCEPIECGGSLLALFLLAIVLLPGNLTAQTKPPNILVIFGDDIGMGNVCAYTHGMMGRTPIIDSKRMETFDNEVLQATLAFMDKYGKGDKPFFVSFNATAIHVWSHPNLKYVQMAVDEGQAETDVVRAKMLDSLPKEAFDVSQETLF